MSFFSTEEKSTLIQHVGKVYDGFIKRNPGYGSDVYLSEMLVTKAIDSASIDIGRMVDYHLKESKKPDRHKVAGFVSKWIAKERPIQLQQVPNLNLTANWVYWVNPAFAVLVMASFLREKMPGEIQRNLEYWFAFREERGETLALIAYCCEQMKN
uniref:Uncharacterized protein n=1 Tax=Candidatus Kentrum sp. FW TaxID=2126338 RepID=A0A450SWE5_9GAMM|nr:MAG: hypothetical protein BECKFW1821B_GA0114236_10411 [Candidatus Kentron sp. FW]